MTAPERRPLAVPEQRVLEALAAANPSPMTATMLLQRRLVPPGAGLMGTQTALHALVRRGYAHPVVTGVYLITATGQAYLRTLHR